MENNNNKNGFLYFILGVITYLLYKIMKEIVLL